MQLIKKTHTVFENQGVQQTKSLVDNCWQEDAGKYINLSYDCSHMNELQKTIFNEQKDNDGFSHCCYCMRTLYLQNTDKHQSNVTLEHVVPQKITEDKWNEEKIKYQKFENLRDEYIVVCFRGELSSSQRTRKITELPYPHFISYHNLVASCNGRTFEVGQLVNSNCCNNKRGCSFVLPVFLDDKMVQDIGYHKDGSLDYDDTKYESVWFQTLNLTCTWLVLIRKLWYKIAQSRYTIRDIEDANDDTKKRQDIIDEIDDDDEIAIWSRNDTCWILLSEYSWFYQYYKNKYSQITP